MAALRQAAAVLPQVTHCLACAPGGAQDQLVHLFRATFAKRVMLSAHTEMCPGSHYPARAACCLSSSLLAEPFCRSQQICIGDVYETDIMLGNGRAVLGVADRCEARHRGYKESMQGVRRRLLQRTAKEGGLLYVAELHGTALVRKMDHLVCFLPGAPLPYSELPGLPVSVTWSLYFSARCCWAQGAASKKLPRYGVLLSAYYFMHVPRACCIQAVG